MAASRFSNSLLPPVVRTLLIANGLMFLLELAYGEPLITALALWPLDAAGSLPGEPVQAHFRLLQLVSYSFLHGSVMHLFLNMYALWLFGTRMELYWGSRDFAIYYLVCVLGAGLVQLLTSSVSGQYYPTVGASGGVFGLLLAFGTPAQQERFVPPMARGDRIGAFCLTEANAGSDAGGVETSAVEIDGGYVLNGTKQWITNGTIADVAVV